MCLLMLGYAVKMIQLGRKIFVPIQISPSFLNNKRRSWRSLGLARNKKKASIHNSDLSRRDNEMSAIRVKSFDDVIDNL